MRRCTRLADQREALTGTEKEAEDVSQRVTVQEQSLPRVQSETYLTLPVCGVDQDDGVWYLIL